MTIQLFSPSITQRERDVVEQTLDSLWLGKGKRVAAFETAWAEHVGVAPENVVSTNSCTSALFEAVRLAGIGRGDEVIIPTIHFVGAAQAVLAAGGTPVFCDVDKWTMNATDETIRTKWTKRTRAVILNHYGGLPCVISRDEFPSNVIWLDDLACAPMVRIDDLGRCDFACWSFDSMKVIAIGDGGMLYSSDPILAKQARQDFCLGVNSESGISSKATERWWEFAVEQKGQGRNLMNDIAASIGLVQLTRLDKMLSVRQRIKDQYLSDPLVNSLALNGEYMGDALYFFWIFVKRRDELAVFLRNNGVYVSWRYWPLHLAYQTGDHFLNSEWASENCLLLPLHSNLVDLEVEYINRLIKEFYD